MKTEFNSFIVLNMMRRKDFLQERQEIASSALKAAGGATALARLLTDRMGKEVKPSRVEKWPKFGVPIDFVLPVSEITGIPSWKMIPGVLTQDQIDALKNIA